MSKDYEVMLDIETLGTGHDAVILSIGACKFDPNSLTEPTDKFYVAIDPESCVAHGLTIDASTVMWWLGFDRAEARDALMKDARHDLGTALEGFRLWFGSDSLPTWGNGATFDNVIMRTAYKKTGMECPWKFWHDRCYRTMKALMPASKPQRIGTHHNALDDALTQARHLQEILHTVVIL